MNSRIACFVSAFLAFSLVPVVVFGVGAPRLEVVKGADVLSEKSISVSSDGRHGVVVVFLSAVCPCSDSHVKELAALAREYTDFAFVGVHSNTDEQKDPTRKYFENAKLPFPVIQDTGAKIADEFKAYKTPHAFVILKDGKVAYRGGVSSSHEFSNADHKYLREALDDLKNKRSVRMPEGRTLGCAIARGEKNVW